MIKTNWRTKDMAFDETDLYTKVYAIISEGKRYGDEAATITNKVMKVVRKTVKEALI